MSLDLYLFCTDCGKKLHTGQGHTLYTTDKENERRNMFLINHMQHNIKFVPEYDVYDYAEEDK